MAAGEYLMFLVHMCLFSMEYLTHKYSVMFNSYESSGTCSPGYNIGEFIHSLEMI